MLTETKLILNQRSFQSVVPQVLLDNDQVAIGSVRRRETSSGLELIIDGWEIHGHTPQGSDLHPLREYAILISLPDPATAIHETMKLIQPDRAQSVVLIVIDEIDHGHMVSLIWTHAGQYPPNEVRFIGPGLARLPAPAAPQHISLRESRTAGALKSQYHRLKQMSVVFVGAGRGMSLLAPQIISNGIRRATIIDDDHVGQENLDAMPHIGPRDVGLSKARLLAKSLRSNQPALCVSILTESVTEQAAIRYLDRTRADCVFSFVDNQAARLATGWKCQQAEMVHVDVGTWIRHEEAGRMMQADIRLFEPGQQGCVACVPKMEQLEDALYTLSAPTGSLIRGRPTKWDQQRSGSLMHLNAMASAIAVELWLGYVSGTVKTSTWTRIFWKEGEPPEIHATSVSSNSDCPFCSRQTDSNSLNR